MAPQFPIETNKIIMDKKLIQQYGEEILCYRLRTARQKKRMRYKEFDKRLIRLHREERALCTQRQNLGWEPLVPPVQKGWKRCFVLRDDVARSKHADFFAGILRKINTYEWSHKKSFMVRRRKRGRKYYIVKPQKLLEPPHWHFSRLNFTDAEKQMFHEEWVYVKWSREPLKKFVFNEPWRFVLKTSPNMITKVKIVDAVLESKLEEIEQWLSRNNYRHRQRKLLDGYCGWRSPKEKKLKEYRIQRRCFRNKTIESTMDEMILSSLYRR